MTSVLSSNPRRFKSRISAAEVFACLDCSTPIVGG
jgi:hypothetical protein